MTGLLKLLILSATLFGTGCYHQVVRTGAPPGPVVVQRPWTATYLFSLVPADAINTATQCPNGVAVVETEQTFVNGLVGALTFGIYTPQTVTITCDVRLTFRTGAEEEIENDSRPRMGNRIMRGETGLGMDTMKGSGRARSAFPA